MKSVNVTLFKFCGLVGGAISGLTVLYLGSAHLDLGVDLWSPDSWGNSSARTLFGLAVVAGLVGMFIGWVIGSRVEVQHKSTHHVLGVLLNYLGIGFLLWGVAAGGYLLVRLGRPEAKDFVIAYGSRLFALQVMVIGTLGSLLAGVTLLATRAIKDDAPPTATRCAMTILPITIAMAVLQCRAWGHMDYAWIPLALAFLLPLVVIANHQVLGDRNRRLRSCDELGQEG